MFYCIETVALAYTGKMLENIYGEECYSQQIQKMTVHQLFLKDFANVNQPEDVLITGTLNLVMKWVNGSSNGS